MLPFCYSIECTKYIFISHSSRRRGGGKPRLDRGRGHPDRRRHRRSCHGLQRLVQGETVPGTPEQN